MTAAERYAAAVVGALVDDFPALKDRTLGRIAPEEIARQAEAPMRSFELIVTYTRKWRLHPAPSCEGRGRVKLICHKDNVTKADIRFAQRLNTALQAIEL
ncbi:MAG: hypothetical protein JWO67_4031 [Streptosporangiaceae bacterium]|nr:hypothetical protein [Streptosporangiaceae bacterium]